MFGGADDHGGLSAGVEGTVLLERVEGEGMIGNNTGGGGGGGEEGTGGGVGEKEVVGFLLLTLAQVTIRSATRRSSFACMCVLE